MFDFVLFSKGRDLVNQQGAPSVAKMKMHGRCMYRGAQNRKCFVGFFITDEMYSAYAEQPLRVYSKFFTKNELYTLHCGQQCHDLPVRQVVITEVVDYGMPLKVRVKSSNNDFITIFNDNCDFIEAAMDKHFITDEERWEYRQRLFKNNGLVHPFSLQAV